MGRSSTSTTPRSTTTARTSTSAKSSASSTKCACPPPRACPSTPSPPPPRPSPTPPQRPRRPPSPRPPRPSSPRPRRLSRPRPTRELMGRRRRIVRSTRSWRARRTRTCRSATSCSNAALSLLVFLSPSSLLFLVSLNPCTPPCPQLTGLFRYAGLDGAGLELRASTRSQQHTQLLPHPTYIPLNDHPTRYPQQPDTAYNPLSSFSPSVSLLDSLLPSYSGSHLLLYECV